MTWGQLRLILQTGAPGVSLDLIDSYLNERYQTVLEATDWKGLKAHSTIQTQAAYQSVLDTVTVTVGSAAVTGSGTTWTIAITGQRFYRPGDTVIYTATYVGATSLTLDRPYEGNGTEAVATVHAASPYVFMQNRYSLPTDCRSIVTVLNPVNGLPMVSFTEDGLDACTGPRTRVADPRAWAQYDDGPETSPPVLHQIEFYPPPLRARGFLMEYLREALVFTGENTTDSPLPFVSGAVLLAGARADIATYLEKLAQAVKYEAAFERELARLLLVEHAMRRVKTAMKMADRFTRHRLARTARGYAGAWRGGTPGGPS